MHEADLEFLRDLGINVGEFRCLARPGHDLEVVDAKVIINMDQFAPMRRHFHFLSTIAESQNPQVRELYGQLVSLAILSEKNNGK